MKKTPRKIFLFGKGSDLCALVDFDLYDKLVGFRWTISSHGYVKRREGSRCVYMHRIIAKTRLGEVTDHLNRNKLDNRRVNLRRCTQKNNTRNTSLQKNNTSGFRGVSWDKQAGKWFAQIKVDGRNLFLGKYKIKKDAAQARRKAELKYFGKFAPHLQDVN